MIWQLHVSSPNKGRLKLNLNYQVTNQKPAYQIRRLSRNIVSLYSLHISKTSNVVLKELVAKTLQFMGELKNTFSVVYVNVCGVYRIKD